MEKSKQVRQSQEAFARTRLQQIHEQILKNDQQLSICSLISSCILLSFFIAGGILAYIGYTPIGILTSISGLIPGIATALFLQQLREVKKQINEIRKELIEEQKALREERNKSEIWNETTRLLTDINDDTQKKQIIASIILQRLGVSQNPQKIPSSTEESNIESGKT